MQRGRRAQHLDGRVTDQAASPAAIQLHSATCGWGKATVAVVWSDSHGQHEAECVVELDADPAFWSSVTGDWPSDPDAWLRVAGWALLAYREQRAEERGVDLRLDWDAPVDWAEAV